MLAMRCPARSGESAHPPVGHWPRYPPDWPKKQEAYPFRGIAVLEIGAENAGVFR